MEELCDFFGVVTKPFEGEHTLGRGHKRIGESFGHGLKLGFQRRRKDGRLGRERLLDIRAKPLLFQGRQREQDLLTFRAERDAG